MGIKENLKQIKEQIGNNKVKIIAVTKYASDKQVVEAYKAGLHNFGESYVQNAIIRIKNLFPPDNQIEWHLIGRLQKNKAKYVVGNFCLVHSVDSLELAEAINKVASKKGLVQNVLLQVNIAKDPSKAGFSPDEILNIFGEIIKLPNIKILGFTTIAPQTGDVEQIKNCFTGLVELKDRLNKIYSTNMQELSMGMSNDYKIAIQCGATIIRIGRAIFNTQGGQKIEYSRKN